MKINFPIFLLLLQTTTFSCRNDGEGGAESYILTPEPSSRPKINGAKVFGVRPGHPVIFTVPVTGNRPMTFRAENLPEGLKLDESNGRFSGSIKLPGTYNIKIHTKNSRGKTERDFRIVVGEQLALTPPMGWNSWNGWGDLVTDENVRTTAKAMVETDLINHGWSMSISILDGRMPGEENIMHSREIKDFLDMKALADYVHSLGLKIGIYSSPWIRGILWLSGRIF